MNLERKQEDGGSLEVLRLHSVCTAYSWVYGSWGRLVWTGRFTNICKRQVTANRILCYVLGVDVLCLQWNV